MTDTNPSSNLVAHRAREYREKRGHWGTHAEALCAEVERLHNIIKPPMQQDETQPAASKTRLVSEETLRAWMRGADLLIQSGVADSAAVCPIALAAVCREVLEMRAHETTALRSGELEQLRRIDRAARALVDSPPGMEDRARVALHEALFNGLPEEPSPPHPGLSIEKAFASSPRRVSYNSNGDAYLVDATPEKANAFKCICGEMHTLGDGHVCKSQKASDDLNCLICGKLWRSQHTDQERADCSAAL